jgi:hypothetical protein
MGRKYEERQREQYCCKHQYLRVNRKAIFEFLYWQIILHGLLTAKNWCYRAQPPVLYTI